MQEVTKYVQMSDYQFVLANYADWRYSIAQKKNAASGLAVGGFDKVFAYGPRDIDKAFFHRNKNILQQKKGNGLWLWKPYFIQKSFEKIREGDYLFYSDAGSYFLESMRELIAAPYLDKDLMVFELPFLEKQFTKRDAFVLMDCDSGQYANSRQIIGGFSLWRKSAFTMRFVEEWLTFAQDERVLSDNENTCGLSNYPEFVAHRHDQSVFSLLTKKHGLIAYRDPTQFGNDVLAQYPTSAYGQKIELTRLSNYWLYRNKLDSALQKVWSPWLKFRHGNT